MSTDPNFPCGILRPLPPYSTVHIFVDAWQAGAALPSVVAHEHWLKDADGAFKQCVLRSYWTFGPAHASKLALRQAATCVEMLVRYSRMPDAKRVVLEFSNIDTYLLAIGALSWRSTTENTAYEAFHRRLREFFASDPEWIVEIRRGDPQRANAARLYRTLDLVQSKKRSSSLYDFDVLRREAEKKNAAFRERVGLWR